MVLPDMPGKTTNLASSSEMPTIGRPIWCGEFFIPAAARVWYSDAERELNMVGSNKQSRLRQLPSVQELLRHPRVTDWLDDHPRALVTDCLRAAVEDVRGWLLTDRDNPEEDPGRIVAGVLDRAVMRLAERTEPNVRGAINATGILLHTALGRAVWPAGVVDSMHEELKGYVTLAIDRRTGRRSERDQRIEPLLQELTGAEAGVVVNNNAAATLLVLAALADGGDVIVSRGQLIEIGGSFRLPDVMELSGATLREIGTTNRTHLRDYRSAVSDWTRAILRVHPSNYRVLGFTGQPSLEELVALAHEHDLPLIDDLGAGALVSLAEFGLPHEPTIQESLAAGADVVLASTDKLIGASQGGVIVGTKRSIDRIRRHPLYRALRVDKTCLMALERTLMLFRDPARLRAEHPLYRMLSLGQDELRRRAESLVEEIRSVAPAMHVEVVSAGGFLGSGSAPMEELPGWAAAVWRDDLSADELARRLRCGPACIFGRVEKDRVLLDVRTILPGDAEAIVQALGAM